MQCFFSDIYKRYPCNLVVRHRDRRIQDRASNVQLTYSPNFQWTYYHLNIGHTAQKNPLFSTNPIVYCDMHKNDQQHATILEQSGIRFYLTKVINNFIVKTLIYLNLVFLHILLEFEMQRRT